ncbi:hypothetical protein EDB19DRAFT_1840343 [Suillus lakei]|nr:hypothetical protein EDB19DRAFT_1840343 [Suillus lakei]
MSQKTIGQVSKVQEVFVRQWAWCIWRSGDGLALKGIEDDGPRIETPGIFMRWGGLTPEVTNISKYSSNILSTNLNVTEDNGPSVKTSVIFCEVVSLVHLEVRGWSGPEGPTLKKTQEKVSPHHLRCLPGGQEGGWTPEVTNIRKYSNIILPTILKATEDDRPSVETPGIFYEMATEDDRPSVETPGIFCEAVGLVHLEATEDDRPSVGTQGIFYEMATEDDRPSVETPGIFCEAVGLVHLEVTEDDGPSLGTPGIFCEAVSLVHLESHDIPFAHGVRTPHDKGIMPAASQHHQVFTNLPQDNGQFLNGTTQTLANLLCLQCSAMLRAPAHHLPCCTRYAHGICCAFTSTHAYASLLPVMAAVRAFYLLSPSPPSTMPPVRNPVVVGSTRCSRSRTDGADKKGFSTESSLTCSMNLLQEDKHYRYLSDEELDAILPATGHGSKQLPYPGSSDSAAAGADDTMGAVDDDFQWETVPADLRHNEMFALAVWDVLVVGDIIFNVLASS